MTVRPATPEDAERCAEISPDRSADELRALLGQSDVRWICVENDDAKVVGIGIVHLWRWNGVAWVWDLRIEEKERRKGYGTALLKGMIEAAREAGAKVLMDFEGCRVGELGMLFLKNGFRVCGVNDRMWPRVKDSTGIYYGFDL